MNEKLKTLKGIAERNLEQRHRDHKIAMLLGERYNEIKNASWIIARMNYFCEVCRKDCEGNGFKEIRWRSNDLWFAFYRGFCPNGHAVIRRITDKLDDPYYFHSRFVQREQAEHADDFVTPHDPRFKHLYPMQWRSLQARSEWEAKKLEKKFNIN